MKKILIIEDDQNIAFALCVRLKAHGYGIWLAADGVIGVNMAVRYKPDLIVLDIALPGANGFSLAEQFRQMPETRRIPFIFATASQDPALRTTAIELGAVGLVRKPYDAEALLLVVKHALAPRNETAAGMSAESAQQATRKDKRTAKTILIVEDDQRVATALSIRMKAAGFQTRVANDALSGIRSAVTEQPDAVVLDISLPAGDGFAVAERILTNIPQPIPIIFLTASKRSDFRQRARELGAAGFFEKPYEAETLLATINRALGEAH